MMNRQQRSPFFVIGSPRSGTTLLRLLLTCHPAVVIPPECGFAIWLRSEFGDWGRDKFSSEPGALRFAQAVAKSRKFETWNISSRSIHKALTQGVPNNYSEACRHIYRLYCSQQGKPNATWGDKNNFYLSHIPELHRIFPDARFLHIVRDGRDVACSYREVMAQASTSPYRPSLPTDIVEIASAWSRDLVQIRTALALLSTDKVLELRYEDLTLSPEIELQALCPWLGVVYDEKMLDFHRINCAKQLEPLGTMGWKPRTLKPVSTDTVGRYTSLLTPKEIATFNVVANAQLRHYGYSVP